MILIARLIVLNLKMHFLRNDHSFTSGKSKEVPHLLLTRAILSKKMFFVEFVTIVTKGVILPETVLKEIER